MSCGWQGFPCQPQNESNRRFSLPTLSLASVRGVCSGWWRSCPQDEYGCTFPSNRPEGTTGRGPTPADADHGHGRGRWQDCSFLHIASLGTSAATDLLAGCRLQLSYDERVHMVAVSGGSYGVQGGMGGGGNEAFKAQPFRIASYLGFECRPFTTKSPFLRSTCRPHRVTLVRTWYFCRLASGPCASCLTERSFLLRFLRRYPTQPRACIGMFEARRGQRVRSSGQ